MFFILIEQTSCNHIEDKQMREVIFQRIKYQNIKVSNISHMEKINYWIHPSNQR